VTDAPGAGIREPRFAVAPAVLLVAAVVVAWELGVRLSNADPIVLPSPSRVATALWDFRADALHHAIVTLEETMAGFAVSLVAAVVLAVAMDALPTIRRALYPLLVGSQTVPIVVIAPLFVIWFGFGVLPKVLVIVLVTFFPIVVALLDGFASAAPEAADLLSSYAATRAQTLRLLRWPSALPALFTGLRIAIAYAVIGAVFAEYVGAEDGLGIWMQTSQRAFRTDLVFGSVAIVAALSITLFSVVGVAERIVVPWRATARRARR
jgi:ABC-type nitrate/sulfonate/bicarbonate transport system permease component